MICIVSRNYLVLRRGAYLGVLHFIGIFSTEINLVL